ncbi:MAG: RNA methyltransferase, partial [Candidatus Thermoplasmatota archaeon]
MDSTNPAPGAPLPSSRFSIILVEPQFRDNVGHTARAMLNFGASDLVLVNAPPVDTQTRNRAVHAQAVLDAARHVRSLVDVTKEFDHVVGFAARISGLDKAHLRSSESLATVARRLEERGGRVALVFGREDFGLSNEDLEHCDMLCTIPTAASYR